MRLVIKKWSPKAVIMKMVQRQPLNIVHIKNQKTQIWNLTEILRFCLKEMVLATVATERTFYTQEQ